MERPGFRQELHPLVVKSQVASGEGELDAYPLAWFQMHATYAPQFPDRTAHAGSVLMHVELHRLIRFARTDVRDIG